MLEVVEPFRGQWLVMTKPLIPAPAIFEDGIIFPERGGAETGEEG
jgi:hypothetical protein